MSLAQSLQLLARRHHQTWRRNRAARNVQEFKLRYLGPGKDGEWIDTWVTSEAGGGVDDTTKNKFPFAVEITMAVRDPSAGEKDKVLRMTMVAAIRNPNNKGDVNVGTSTP